MTRPDLPPLRQIKPLLKTIWKTKQLTNNGPFHRDLEARLCDFLQVEHISLFANGTLALIAALKALDISGEVITTPYSFVATTHALVWCNLQPIFVDISDVDFNIRPDLIESAISPATSAIVAVHTYGLPCDTSKIQGIAEKHDLKLIYDAAHAFGVKDGNGSILRHGDLSVVSFHATKIFNTFEGGAVICKNADIKRKLDLIKNFGFEDETTISLVGLNAKMNEFSAALGCLQLDGLKKVIRKCRKIDNIYRTNISTIKGLSAIATPAGARLNFSYFPIRVNDDYPLCRDLLYEKMKHNNIFCRRYFYPLISNLPMYRHLPSADHRNLPASNMLANTVLCLPIYSQLKKKQQQRIIKILRHPLGE